MKIEEIRKMKWDMEVNLTHFINAMVQDFQKRTGLAVDTVQVTGINTQEMGSMDSPLEVTGVNMVVEI